MKKLIIFLSIFIAFSCESDTDLTESVFVADSENPELPAYTEWGYNTFGAIYERSVFLYNEDEIPLKIIIENNELVFVFQGVEGSYYGDEMTLKFAMPSSNIESYEDLITFNSTVVDLTGDGCSVKMVSNDYTGALDIIDGEIDFVKSQKVLIDDEEKGIILSGTFYIKFILDELPVTMSNGRFDFGVNNAIFYNLD